MRVPFFFIIITIALISIWLARPWSGDAAIANSAYRGIDYNFTASSSCVALGDAGAFDWSKISSDIDLEKCILSVSRQLKSADALSDWMRSQGFEVADVYDTVPKGGKHVSAVWDGELNKSIYPYDSGLNRVFSRLRMYGIKLPFLIPSGYRVEVVFEENNSIKLSVGPDYL